MYATEFKTVINEPYIGVSEFEKFKGREVRVIIIDIDDNQANPIETDFIAQIVKNPKHIEKNGSFLSRDEANDGIKEFIISCLNRYKIINVEPSTLLKAVEIRKQYNISYYDSSIIAAAIEANARILYSEDMQDSLTISELTIVNPFKK